MRTTTLLAIVLALAAGSAYAQTFTCAANGDGTCTNLIPDAKGATPGVLRSVITVPAGCPAANTVTVGVAVTHDFVGDLRLRLTNPAGTTHVLLDRSGLATLPPGGCSSDDIDVTFDDAGAAPACPHTIPALSGAIAPVEPLAGFVGAPGSGTWTLEVSDAVHSGTGALEGWSLTLGCNSENCTNCVDDDGDGLTDRDDPDCGAAANGGGAGLGDARGKAATKCLKAIQKAGAQMTTRRLAHLQKCTEAVLTCVEKKAGDAGCLGKAKSRCDKELGGASGEGGKLAAAITGKCGNAADLLEPAGLGFSAEGAACAALGIGSLATSADVAACVRARHECAVNGALGVEVPRAAELLGLAGHAASELPCLGAIAGSGAGVGDAGRAKAVLKCNAAIKKAGAQAVAKRTKLFQKCVAVANACVQTNDAKCRAGIGRTCKGQIGKVGGVDAKLRGAVIKGCPGSAIADILAGDGLGFGGIASACAGIGAGATSQDDVASCLVGFHACRAKQVAESESPRLRELLQLGGVPLP